MTRGETTKRWGDYESTPLAEIEREMRRIGSEPPMRVDVEIAAVFTSDAVVADFRAREALRRERIALAASLMRAAAKFGQPHLARQAAAILTFG